MSATDPQREALAELTEAVAVSGSTGAQPSADWCACIFEDGVSTLLTRLCYYVGTTQSAPHPLERTGA